MTATYEPRRAGRSASGRAGIAAHDINWKNPSDGDLISFIDAQVVAHDARHWEWVRKSRVQLAWAAGDQLKIWDDNQSRLIDSYDVQADRIALWVNRIKPAILNFISIITARPVSFRVSPATAENDDMAAAKVQDKLVRYYWRRLLADTPFIEMLWMVFCTGCAFLRSTWDSNIGSERKLGATDLGIGEMGAPEGNRNNRARFVKTIADLMGIDPEDASDQLDGNDTVSVFDGDLTCDLLTGFDIIPPVGAVSIKKAPWLVVRQPERIEDLREAYGAKAKDLMGGYHEPFAPAAYELNSGDRESRLQLTDDLDHATTYEIWRPDLKYCPGGFRAKICQGKVLVKGKNPYEHGEIPIVMVQELPSPKQFWPPSTIEDLMPIQAEVNITASQIAEHKASTIEPTKLAERGIGLDEMAFTAHNEIVEVNAGKIEKIKPWVPEPLPAYLPWLQQNLRQDFDDVSRNHPSSYGKQSGSVRSGKQAIAMQEADARLNTPMLRMLRASFGDVARHWLRVLHQFTDEARTTTLIGENHEPEVIVWSTHDLPTAEFNVECDLGPAVDRETTLDLIDKLTARGWLVPTEPAHRGTVFKWMGEGIAHQIDESENDRRNAAIENMKLLRGEPATLSDGDDDSVHLEEHTRMQKTGQYRAALAQGPDVEEAFEIHKRHHERSRIMKRMRQEIAQLTMQRDLMAANGLNPQPEQGAGAGGNGRSGQPQKRNGRQQQGRPSGAPNAGTYHPRQGKMQVQGRRADRASRGTAPRLGTGSR